MNIDDKSDPLDQGQQNPGDPESVIPFGFCLKLQITPQMKLHQKLQNNIEQKSESKPKLKI